MFAISRAIRESRIESGSILIFIGKFVVSSIQEIAKSDRRYMHGIKIAWLILIRTNSWHVLKNLQNLIRCTSDNTRVLYRPTTLGI